MKLVSHCWHAGFVKNIGLFLASMLFPRGAFAAKSQKAKSTKGGLINLSGPAYVTEIRHWSSPAYSRISVTLDRETRYEHRLLKQDRETAISQSICIDIKDAGLSEWLNDIPAGGGLLKSAN